MKMTKTVVEAKTRQLNAEYTVKYDDQYSNELEKILQEELDREILANLIRSQGWHEVQVNQFSDIEEGWCEKYIKRPHICLGCYWFFEDERDAHFFLLKWGSDA